MQSLQTGEIARIHTTRTRTLAHADVAVCLSTVRPRLCSLVSLCLSGSVCRVCDCVTLGPVCFLCEPARRAIGTTYFLLNNGSVKRMRVTALTHSSQYQCNAGARDRLLGRSEAVPTLRQSGRDARLHPSAHSVGAAAPAGHTRATRAAAAGGASRRARRRAVAVRPSAR